MSNTSHFSRPLWAACAALAISVLPASVRAQSDSSRLTLERIFASSELNDRDASSIRWTADGRAYTALEPARGAHGGRDLVRHDVATGKSEIVVAAERLVPKGATAAMEIEDYQSSADGRRFLIFTNPR